jgi:hypothetical protein
VRRMRSALPKPHSSAMVSTDKELCSSLQRAAEIFPGVPENPDLQFLYVWSAAPHFHVFHIRIVGDCPPGRRGKTTIIRAAAIAISRPRSSSTKAKARAIPALIPPEE